MPYIPFTQEQKETANNTDLVRFLQCRGEKLESVGRDYKLTYYDSTGKHDSITIRGSTWFDHKNQTGGGAIKFMQEFYGLDFQTAVNTLLGANAVNPSISVSTKPIVMAKEKKKFILPEENPTMHRVFAYLIKQRFIEPEILSHFAHEHKIYEDKAHHNAVFVGFDEKGVAKQCSLRSTSSYGKTFRIIGEGSDTRYSFAHFGNSDKLFVFEAPIDMLSYITLNKENWQDNSFIAMNGVYENAVLTALKSHSNLSEIVICTDNDEGGIEAVERLTDILKEMGYENISRKCPHNKDWNEDLKEANGVDFLPAVPLKRIETYKNIAHNLYAVKCSSENLPSRLSATYKNKQYNYLAEYALAGSEYYLSKHHTQSTNNFECMRNKLCGNYRAYKDKGRKSSKEHNLSSALKTVQFDLKRTARTREQEINTAKLLFNLADCAVKCEVQNTLDNPIIVQEQEAEPQPEFGYG